jgi:small-conductance mechanosensitive channel
MGEVLRQVLTELETKAPQFVVAAGVFIAMVAIGYLLGLGVSRLVARSGHDGRWKRLSGRLVRWAATLFGGLLALQILGYTAVATSLLATGGVAAVVLGFAFREIGENMLAGFFMAFSRSFDVGDLIESGGLRGVVREITLRATHIRTADGCDIFIPSAQIFSQPLHNFTRDGFRRASFTIGVDYGDEPERALEVVRAAVTGVRGVVAEPPPAFQLARFDGSWMELEANLWVDIRDPEKSDGSLSTVRTRAMVATRRALLDAGFTLSSDTTTALAVPPLDVRVTRTTDPDA